MLRRPDLGLAHQVRNPNLLGKINAAAASLNKIGPVNKNAMIKELLKSQGKQSGIKVGSSSSDSSSSTTSGIGYILLLLSSLLLLIGWFGSWMPDNNNNYTTTPTMPPDSTTTSEEPIINDKYGCSFGFQGRLCDPCGVQPVKPNTKIVGGVDAIPHSWPFQALLAYSYSAKVTIPGTNTTTYYNNTNTFICGGSLITRDTVLTAAHCIDDTTASFIVEYNNSYYWYPTVPNQYYPTLASRYSVYLGAHNQTAALLGIAPAIRVPAVYIQVHPQYNLDGKLLNDIAIIKLAYEVNLTNNVQLACLPNPQIPHYPTTYGVNTYAMGWGTTEQGGNVSEILQNVVLDLLDGPTQCYPDNQDQFNWNTQVCSGILAGGKDTCQGDSGGPLYIMDLVPDQNGTHEEKYVQVGVVSYGPGCANAGYPGLYTRVSGYHAFIQEFI